MRYSIVWLFSGQPKDTHIYFFHKKITHENRNSIKISISSLTTAKRKIIFSGLKMKFIRNFGFLVSAPHLHQQSDLYICINGYVIFFCASVNNAYLILLFVIDFNGEYIYMYEYAESVELKIVPLQTKHARASIFTLGPKAQTTNKKRRHQRRRCGMRKRNLLSLPIVAPSRCLW